MRLIICILCAVVPTPFVYGHGTAINPKSRVRHVYESNPENPSFELARDAVAMDGTSSYYTWNEVSQNIPAAVQAGLPPGFDYSPWVPDGQIASGGRTEANTPGSARLYDGLDQVSADWPTAPVNAGELLSISFLATAPHDPSVWDLWLTTSDWEPSAALSWQQMEFLGRANATLTGQNYLFDVEIPADRSGHHVLWIAWQRDDPVGEVFFSTSDLFVSSTANAADFDVDGDIDGSDFLDWQLGMSPTPAGLSDLNDWQNSYGATASISAASGIPEPSAVTLALVGLALVGLRRHR
jgi:chitin-binding protein